MHRSFRILASVLLLLSSFGASSVETQSVSSEKKGTFVNDHTYTNPALGMTMVLPGTWQFFEQPAQEQLGVAKEASPPEAGCPGPFCKNLEIEVRLISKSLNGAVFLDGYKLSTQYLDRRRYPLKMFADAMTTGSVAGTDWIVSSELMPIQLDGKPAYRLLVHKPQPMGEAKGFGYVTEANGYVFLMIGTVPDLHPEYPKELQASLESMKLGRAEVPK
jgi:hypothetical protein